MAIHKHVILFTIIFQTISIVGYGQADSPQIKNVEWLEGTWVNETKRGSIYETWIKVSDQELFGKSYQIKEQDTLVSETVRLIEESDNLFYIPTVTNQNQGKPIRFTLTELTDSTMKFENPEHNSPNVIYYRKDGENKLMAEIWSVREGQIRKMQFPMKRIR